MYIQHNTVARSCNNCSSGKTITITYSEHVFVASGTQREMRMHRIVLFWPIQLYNIFPHYPINGTIFEKKKSY